MKKYIKILFIAFLGIFSTSCSNWLNLSPEDGVTREEFWQTKEQVNSAVVGCYSAMVDGPVDRMFLWGELRADMVDNGLLVSPVFNQIIDGEISASSSVVSWADFYQVINNCNTVLKFAPSVQKIDGTFTDKQLKEYEAEALTIRAMMYFYLVRSFKDVPLVTDASVSDDQNYAISKTPGAEILDTLVRDLKIAVMNAPLSYSSTAKNKSRITANTAKTLLADIYLWQENYTECNNLCQQVIASGMYSMIPVATSLLYIKDIGGSVIDSVTIPSESDAERMFTQSYVTGNSVESIFELPFTTTKQNPFYAILGPVVNLLKPKSDVVDGLVFPTVTHDEGDAKDAVDIRGTGCSFRGGFIWKYIGVSRNGGTSNTRTSTNYTAPWIIYKYSDILLMKAEALNQLGIMASGDTKQTYFKDAAAAMKIVRTARNAVMTDEYKYLGDIDGKTLEKSILDERAREFAYEGKRWYDVLRFAKRNDYAGIQYLLNMAINSASPEKQQSLMAKYKDPKHNSHYWPISETELEANKALKQNEFYAK
jgi:starch-binding outer membrane protein, SusD/RagB family